LPTFGVATMGGLLERIDYYKNTVSLFKKESNHYIALMKKELDDAILMIASQHINMAVSDNSPTR